MTSKEKLIAAPAQQNGARSVLVVIALSAVVLRLGPLLTRNLLGAQLEYDDAVHFSAAQHLLAGSVPYRDFVFVQPPGISIILLPFALLARGIGDTATLAALRIVVTFIGALNAVLVARLLLRYGRVAALLGGLMYATWGALVFSERTILLEPLLNLALLAALLLLRRPGRGALVWAAVLVGSACALKLWGLVDAAVLTALVGVRFGGRAAATWVAWAGGAALLWCLPVVVFDPAAAWRQVVADQFGRAPAPDPFAFRFGYFRLVVDLGTPIGRVATVLLSLLLLALAAAAIRALSPVVAALRARRSPTQWPEVSWWGLLLLAQGVTIALSPSTFYHYSAFAAVSFCLVVGVAGGELLERVAQTRWWRPAVGALGLLGVAMAGASWTHQYVVAPASQAAQALAARHHCTWALTQAALEAADAVTTNLARHCPMSVDAFGEALDLTARQRIQITPASVKGLSAWQQAIQVQFLHSDAAILSGELASAPFSDETMRLWSGRFTLTGRDGGQTLWVAKT